MKSIYLFDADRCASESGQLARASVAVANVTDLFTEFAEARSAGRVDRMQEIRDHAAALDPELAVEFDGFDYPAVA